MASHPTLNSAKCPVCQAPIKEDFGLVTCPSCGSQVLLELDGAASPAAPSHEPEEIDSAPPALSRELSQVLVSEVASESLSNIAPPLPEIPAEDAIEPEFVSQFHQPPPEIAPASPDLSDIAAYGNSSLSQGREGMLRFNIYMSGIDTVDIRRQIQEALTDARFLWNVEAMVSGIRGGELKISDVTAVKAALVIQRLRTIPIEIRWEQYAIHTA